MAVSPANSSRAAQEVDKSDTIDPPTPRYRDNSIDAFRSGACLDLRVRFAMELLTHSPIFANSLATPPSIVAEHALDVTTELFAEAERRHLIEPFKEFEHDKHLQGHVRRQVAFQLFGQKEGQKQQAADGAMIQQVAGAPPFARKPN